MKKNGSGLIRLYPCQMLSFADNNDLPDCAPLMAAMFRIGEGK
ncbi:MAG: hypothetical protein ACREP0_02700 [Rhodanobacteraceae bacterium]